MREVAVKIASTVCFERSWRGCFRDVTSVFRAIGRALVMRRVEVPRCSQIAGVTKYIFLLFPLVALCPLVGCAASPPVDTTPGRSEEELASTQRCTVSETVTRRIAARPEDVYDYV